MKAQLLAGVSAAVAGALSIGSACTNPALDTVNHVEGKGDVEIGTARFSVEPLQSISDINGGHADTGNGGGTEVGVVIETPAVRIDSLRELVWRVRGVEPGVHPLVVRAGEDSLEKEIVVGGRWAAVSEKRTGDGFFDSLLFPGEAPIDSSSLIKTVEIQYAKLPLSILGFRLHWLVVFFVASIAFGFAFRRPLGVEI